MPYIEIRCEFLNYYDTWKKPDAIEIKVRAENNALEGTLRELFRYTDEYQTFL